MVRLEPKTSAEVRNYTFDWSTFLGELDTIATSNVVVSGVTLNSQSHNASSVTITISGGVSGTIATITNTITTAAGLTETETYSIRIDDVGEPLSLAEVKSYLRVRSNDEDPKIAAMIPRARRWVEDHTGLAMGERQFVERLMPEGNGFIRLSYAPLVSLDPVDYVDGSGSAATLTATAYPPSPAIFYSGGWPSLADNEAFEITYTAGVPIENLDDRLLGAMYALIEGEFSDGFAYPPRATEAAERCLTNVRRVVA